MRRPGIEPGFRAFSKPVAGGIGTSLVVLTLGSSHSTDKLAARFYQISKR